MEKVQPISRRTGNKHEFRTIAKAVSMNNGNNAEDALNSLINDADKTNDNLDELNNNIDSAYGNISEEIAVLWEGKLNYITYEDGHDEGEIKLNNNHRFKDFDYLDFYVRWDNSSSQQNWIEDQGIFRFPTSELTDKRNIGNTIYNESVTLNLCQMSDRSTTSEHIIISTLKIYAYISREDSNEDSLDISFVTGIQINLPTKANQDVSLGSISISDKPTGSTLYLVKIVGIKNGFSSEVVDLRITHDGKHIENAQTAIRTQFSDIATELQSIRNGVITSIVKSDDSSKTPYGLYVDNNGVLYTKWSEYVDDNVLYDEVILDETDINIEE